MKELYPLCELITFDFANTADFKDYEELCSSIEAKAKEMGGEISVLVNNVQQMDLRNGKIYKATDEELI